MMPKQTVTVSNGLFAILSVVMVGCGITDAPAPDPDRFINIAVVGGAEQVGLPNTSLAEPLSVRLTSTVTDEPITAREVSFNVPASSGITVTPAVVATDNNGIARTTVRLGSAVGRYNIEINFTGNPGAPSSATVEAALAPVVAQVSPTSVTADGTIVITGENFSSTPAANHVVVEGTRALVTSATTTRLEARLSACLPTRTSALTVNRGALQSNAAQISVTAAATTQAIAPARGQLITLDDRNTMGCVRLAPHTSDAEYLVVTQHTANSGAVQVPLRMVGLRVGGGTTARPVAPATVEGNVAINAEPDAAMQFKQLLRERAAAAMKSTALRSSIRANQSIAAAVVPAVGDRRVFRVFVPRAPARSITAAARVIGKQFAIYEDIEAEGSIPVADLEQLVQMLDDVIHATGVAVFGAASDIDRNERIVILLTPGVNRLTAANETSFINGYFDPCDLSDVAECSDTNRAEILYSVVPDPTGKWGLQHSQQSVIRLLPSLIAHELEHLIHYNQRTFVSNVRTPEDLWLSEAMAHFAEDTVAGVLRGLGRTTDADRMARENLIRANFFLSAPEKTSLIASTGQATIEERGAAWLFVKYLNFQVGGNFLRRLETTSTTGAASIAAITGKPWPLLMRDWSIALYASGATELAGLTLARELGFGAFDLRAALAAISTQGFPLRPVELGANDISKDWTLSPSGTSFARLTVPAGGAVNLVFTGERGGDFNTSARPQILLFRIR